MRLTSSPPDPVYVSWSGLKRWEACPQHHLRVIQKKVEKQNMGRIFLPGTVCDLTQRRWLESDNPQPGEMREMVHDVMKQVLEEGESRVNWRGDPREDAKNVLEFCRDTVTRLEPWLMDNVLPFDYQPEVKFKAHLQVPYICDGALGPVSMRGGIDIVVRDDQGKFRLYDLKVTKAEAYIRSTLAQLTFYDLAWGIIQGDFYHGVEWGFITPALENTPIIPITVDREDRSIMLARVVKYAQGFWRDEWTPKADDEGCQWCEANKVCDKFKTIAFQDANGKNRISFDTAAAQRAQFRSQNRT